MNPNLNAFLTSVQALLIVIGGIMAKEGLEHTTAYSQVMIASGSIMVLGPAVWGVWASISNWRKAAAVGVQAGINLTVAGKAVTESGAVISQFSADASATPPKPVTLETAQQIVKDFAPATPPAKA